MIRSYRAPRRVRVFYSILWSVQKAASFIPELFAGVCFGFMLFFLLPIMAAFFA